MCCIVHFTRACIPLQNVLAVRKGHLPFVQEMDFWVGRSPQKGAEGKAGWVARLRRGVGVIWEQVATKKTPKRVKPKKLSSTRAQFEHLFPAPSSKLYQEWLRHWRGALNLQGFERFEEFYWSVHCRCRRPPKGLGTNKTVEATQRPSTHVNMRRVRSGYEKCSVSSQTILVSFVLA